MTNVSGPDFITLLVSDLEASYKFYKERLGLPESSERRPDAHAFSTKPRDPDGYVLTAHDGG